MLSWKQQPLLLHWCSKKNSQLCWIMSLLISNAIESHMRNQNPWLFDAVDLMVVSATGFQSLPTNTGTQTFLGLSHTSTGSHMPHSLPASVSFSVCFFTHKCAVKWLFQHSLVGRRKNIPCRVYQAIWMWLCKWALLDPCDSVDIWSPHWLWW